MAQPVRTLLGPRRRAAGWSVTALAERVGVSRQALATIESGRSTPSTALALRLGRALGCRVEELFALADRTVPDLQDVGPAGTRVVVGRVAERWVAHALSPGSTEAADGLVGESGAVESLGDLEELEHTVLVAGCAPVLGALSMHLARHRGGSARWLQRTSADALRALAEGRTHVAGLHLASAQAPETHDALVREELPGVSVDVVGLVGWREGLAVAPGNPRGIRSVEDLGRPDVRVGRRPAGAGATRVLHRELERVGLDPSALRGPAVASHSDAARAIVHGAADAAVLVEPVAEAHGLPFVPLAEERFELVMRARDRGHPGVVRLLEQLATARFAREVRCMGAYDTELMGVSRHLEAA